MSDGPQSRGDTYRAAFGSGLFRFSELARCYDRARAAHHDFISVLGPRGHVAGYTRFDGEAWARMYCERPEDENGEPTGAYGNPDLDVVVFDRLDKAAA